jgi:hypothetical protein
MLSLGYALRHVFSSSEVSYGEKIWISLSCRLELADLKHASTVPLHYVTVLPKMAAHSTFDHPYDLLSDDHHRRNRCLGLKR